MTNPNNKNFQFEHSACQSCAARGTNHCPSCGTNGNALSIEELAMLQGISVTLTAIYDLLESLQYEQENDERPFEEIDLIEDINNFASLTVYNDGELFICVPRENLDDFLFPLLEELLEVDALMVLLDRDTAIMNLTEICDVYGIDAERVHELSNV